MTYPTVTRTYDGAGWLVCVQSAGEGVCRWVPHWRDRDAITRAMRDAVEQGQAVSA